MTVVDALEMVDVEDRQPVLLIAAAAASAGGGRVLLGFVVGGLAEDFEQVFVEGLAIGEAGQRICLTIVEERELPGCSAGA